MRLPNSPIGTLMAEHRLIDRMLVVMDAEDDRIARTGQVDPDRIDAIVEFLAVYVDRNHHGKEEFILFERLAEKDMAPEHAELMEQLIEGHRFARTHVQRLREASGKAREGDMSVAETVRDAFKVLAEFYPEHIEAEDHRFFKPAINYFTLEEREQMQEAFVASDRALVHELYEEKLAFLEGAAERQPVTL